MASITNRNAEKYRHLGQDEELPREQVPTLRDRILAACVARQLDTSARPTKAFVRATVEEPITSHTSGLLSFRDFTDLESRLVVKEVLRSSGLDDSEIQLLLCDDDSRGEAPLAQQARLKEIERKLTNRQEQLDAPTEPEQFNGAIALNRHQYEEECNAVPITDAADKLTACLVRLEPHSDNTIHPQHPINTIKDFAQQMFPEDDVESRVKRNCADSTFSVKKRAKPEKMKFKYLDKKPDSFWDMKEIPKIIGNAKEEERGIKTKEKEKGENTMGKDKVKQNYRTTPIKVKPAKVQENINKTKQFILTLNPSELIPMADILANKITTQEIKKDEKFSNYNEGNPSNVLYIKNLPHKLTPHDLASVIGHFESGSKVQYRILDGRMRGQAFVTFQDEDTARRALETLHGYVLQGKPMIIAYGRK